MIKNIAKNPVAMHNYEILEALEAGIVLTGTEIKSIRNGRVNLKDSYATILKSKFPEIKDEITSAPLIIYIKDGKGVEAMSSELKMIDYKVLDKLVSKYGIE